MRKLCLHIFLSINFGKRPELRVRTKDEIDAAAAFIAPETPTRLPTFTPPAEIVIPTFVDEGADQTNRIPIGLLIFSLGFVGALGVLISFLRGR